MIEALKKCVPQVIPPANGLHERELHRLIDGVKARYRQLAAGKVTAGQFASRPSSDPKRVRAAYHGPVNARDYSGPNADCALVSVTLDCGSGSGTCQ